MTDQPGNDKLFREATIGDYESVRRRSMWYSNLRFILMADFLNLDGPIDKAVILSETLSNYEKHIVCVAFDNYLVKTGYKIERTYGGDSSDIYPFEYEDQEVGYKTFKKTISEGVLLLKPSKEGGHPLVFAVDYFSNNSYKVNVYSNSNGQEAAQDFLRGLREYAKENNYLKNKKITPDMTFLEVSGNYTWESVILDEKTKSTVRREFDIVMKYADIYAKNGIQSKRGIILQGPPGVGKTLIGKVLCNVAPCTVIWVTPKFLERSSDIARIGEMARELSPSILFLEDVDLYAQTRESNGHKTLLGEMLSQLDGIQENKNVIVVATTNKGEELEKALKNRPGRFDTVVTVELPGEKEKQAMLELYTGRFQKDGVDFAALSKELNKYTGAHVKDLVDLAILTAVEEGSYDSDTRVILKQEHFLKNVKTVGKKEIAPGFGAGVGKSSLDDSLDDERPNYQQ